MKGQLPDPHSNDQIALIAPVIHDREFGVTAGDWDRILERALEDPQTYAAAKVRRIVATAQHVLHVLREALAP
jgi:hypothetical protein